MCAMQKSNGYIQWDCCCECSSGTVCEDGAEFVEEDWLCQCQCRGPVAGVDDGIEESQFAMAWEINDLWAAEDGVDAMTPVAHVDGRELGMVVGEEIGEL